MADPRRRPRLVAVVPGGVVVAHGTLDPMTQVRILAGQLPSPTEQAKAPRIVSERVSMSALDCPWMCGTIHAGRGTQTWYSRR